MKSLTALLVCSAVSLAATNGLAQDPKAAVEPAGTDWKLVGGVASTVTGIGFVGLFNLSFFRLLALKSDDRFEQYKAGRSGDVCDAAEKGKTAEDRYADSVCSDARTYELLELVSLPLSIAAITAGVILIARSGPPDPEPPVSVGAQVGPHAGRLDLVVRF